MPNIKGQKYKKIFESLIEILKQDYIFNLPLKSITTDIEFQMIRAIKLCFPGMQRIGCWFHLKHNLGQYAHNIGLLKLKTKKNNTK